jgi:hypothetical protein
MPVAEQCARIALVLAPNPEANVMSREQAIARKTELSNDRQWVQRFLAGGAAERREINDLDAIIVRRH